MVLVARRIHTLDAANPVATAVVFERGRIRHVGDEAGALREAGPDAVVDRFPEGVVVPGLADAHGHLAGLGDFLAQVDVAGVGSEAEAVARVVAAGPGPQGWVLGRGWDQTRWPGGAFPTAASLDTALPGVPVVLSRVDGHAVWASSEALRRAGVTGATVDPPGGRYLRDAAGRLTGVAVDNAADVVQRAVPPPSDEEKLSRLKRAVEHLVALGLTSIHDAGLDDFTFGALQAWDARGTLPLRVYGLAWAQDTHGERWLEAGPFGGRHLEVRGVKLMADGALGSRGAALHAPYQDEPSSTGLLLMSPEALRARAQAFAARGFQVAIHAIGDRANTLALDILTALPAGGRHRVEHAQVVRPVDVRRFAAAEVVASVQPRHATSDMRWAAARLGAERVTHAYAWQTLRQAGARLALGSDFPVEPADPLKGLHAARTRQDEAGQPAGGFFASQRLTARQALEGFTVGAAYASFAEGRRGTITAGKDADFTVLDVDPLEDEPRALLRARVLATIIDGADVYRAP